MNISWLKKNEMDLRNHVTELRNSIRNNWSTTGQELGKELSKYWPPSRPASPARGVSQNNSLEVPKSSSPAALAHLGHLDIPRGESPSVGGNSDFAAGYSLGLIGGVRSWVSLSCPISIRSPTQRSQTDQLRIDDAQSHFFTRQSAW